VQKLAFKQVHIQRLYVKKIRLKQIILNLLSNASKFTPPGGKIKLSAKENGDEYWIAVEDTGKGIPEQDFERVFDKFQQLDSGYTKKFAGTGIGLALVRQFATLHKGRVWVESEIGKGTTFRFNIPKKLRTPKKIGEILVEDGLITEEQLKEKLKKQQGFDAGPPGYTGEHDSLIL